MLDVDAAGQEIAARGATVADDLIGYGFAPDSPVAPAFFPESWEVDFTREGGVMMGGGAVYEMSFLLLVSRADDKSGQARRNELVKAIVEALHSGAYTSVSDLQVTAARAPADFQEYGGVSYVVAEVDVEVFG